MNETGALIRPTATNVLAALEWSYPPTDSVKNVSDPSSWRKPSRCPLCFGEYPKHRDECDLAFRLGRPS